METSGGDQTGASLRQAQVAEQKITKKVMVALDESDSSFYALRWALDHLFHHYPSRGGGAAATMEVEAPPDQDTDMVVLVHVEPPFQPFVYPAGPVVYATPAVVEAVNKAQEESAAILLSQALQFCKQKMVKAETLMLKGDPKDSICQAAEEMHVDLLVLGSRGLGAIKRAFLGSVSDYCAHHAHCPILIVKPPKERHERA